MSRETHLNKRQIALAVLAPLVAMQLGCYATVPVSGDMARSGTRVQVDLSDSGTSEMARQVGPHIRTVLGDVTTVNDRELVLAVRAVTDVRGIESFWSGEPITVPRVDIVGVSERRLSKSRTALLTTGMIAGLFLTGRAFGLFSGGDGGRGDIPVTQ